MNIIKNIIPSPLFTGTKNELPRFSQAQNTQLMKLPKDTIEIKFASNDMEDVILKSPNPDVATSQQLVQLRKMDHIYSNSARDIYAEKTWSYSLMLNLLSNGSVHKYLADNGIFWEDIYKALALKVPEKLNIVDEDSTRPDIDPSLLIDGGKRSSTDTNREKTRITKNYWKNNIVTPFLSWCASQDLIQPTPVDLWRWLVLTDPTDNINIFLQGATISKSVRDRILAAPMYRTHIDQGFLEPTKEDLANIDNISKLGNIVVGQPHVTNFLIDTMKAALEEVKMDEALDYPNRPVFIFTLFGPSGTGKTFTINTVFKLLGIGKEDTVKIRLNEYTTGGAVTKIIGAPPGHTGYDDGASVAEKVIEINRRKNEGFFRMGVLIDEIEKAEEFAPEVNRSLMNIFTDGELGAATGETAYFRGALIGVTSNLIQEEIKAWMEEKNDDGTPKYTDEQIAKMAEAAIRDSLPPEMVGRLGTFIFMRSLSVDDVRQILMMKVEDYVGNAAEQKRIDIQLTDNLVNYIAEEAHDPNTNARELDITFKNKLTTPLTLEFIDVKMNGLVDPSLDEIQGTIVVDYDKDTDKVTFEHKDFIKRV